MKLVWNRHSSVLLLVSFPSYLTIQSPTKIKAKQLCPHTDFISFVLLTCFLTVVSRPGLIDVFFPHNMATGCPFLFFLISTAIFTLPTRWAEQPAWTYQYWLRPLCLWIRMNVKKRLKHMSFCVCKTAHCAEPDSPVGDECRNMNRPMYLSSHSTLS